MADRKTQNFSIASVFKSISQIQNSRLTGAGVIVAFILVFSFYSRIVTVLKTNFEDRVSSSAQQFSVQFSESDLNDIVESKNIDSDSYKNVAQKLTNLTKGGSGIQEIYILYADQTGTARYLASSNDSKGTNIEPGDLYDQDYSETLTDEFKTSPEEFSTYEHSDEPVLSAYSRIDAENNSVQFLLGVDISRKTYTESIYSTGWFCAVTFVLLVLLICIVSYLFKRQDFMLKDIMWERNLLRSITNTIPDAIFIKGRNGRYEFVNRQFAKSLGYSNTNDIIGKLPTEVNENKAVAQKYIEEDERIMRMGQSVIKKDERITDKDGTVRSVFISKCPVLNSKRKVIGLVGIITDVSREIEERNLLKKLIDLMPDYIYVKDRQSRFMVASQKLLTRLGAKNHEKVIGKTDHDFFPKDQADGFKSDEEFIMSNDIPIVNKPEKQTDVNGKTIYISTTKVPFKDLSNEIVGIVGIGRDITAEIEEKNRLRLLIDSVPDSIFIKDLDGKYIAVNKRFANDAGFDDPTKLTGKTSFDVYPKDVAKRYIKEDEYMLKNDAAVINKRTIKERNNGTKQYIITNKTIIYDNSGNKVGIIGVIRDVTDVKTSIFEKSKSKSKS